MCVRTPTNTTNSFNRSKVCYRLNCARLHFWWLSYISCRMRVSRNYEMSTEQNVQIIYGHNSKTLRFKYLIEWLPSCIIKINNYIYNLHFSSFSTPIWRPQPCVAYCGAIYSLWHFRSSCAGTVDTFAVQTGWATADSNGRDVLGGNLNMSKSRILVSKLRYDRDVYSVISYSY